MKLEEKTRHPLQRDVHLVFLHYFFTVAKRLGIGNVACI